MLSFDPEQEKTYLLKDGQNRQTIPFLVKDPGKIRDLVQEQKKGYNRTIEVQRFKEQVRRAVSLNTKCHFESTVSEKGETIQLCSSAMRCPLRKWRAKLGLPECTKGFS